jgi:hypothetical protein
MTGLRPVLSSLLITHSPAIKFDATKPEKSPDPPKNPFSRPSVERFAINGFRERAFGYSVWTITRKCSLEMLAIAQPFE